MILEKRIIDNCFIIITDGSITVYCLYSGGPPFCKQFLSEEKMAAKMHNLRISNDHGYIGNGMPLFNDWSTPHQLGGTQGYGDRRANNESERKCVER